MMNFSQPQGERSLRIHTPFAAVVASVVLACSLALVSDETASAAETSAHNASVQFDTDTAFESPLGPAPVEESPAAKLVRQLDETIRQAEHDAAIEALTSTALSFEGTPYSYGGTTPRGFDCSGFVLYCMREALGVEMPRTAAAQSSVGERVPMDALERGDLLFWGSGSGVYHVGIYLEDNTYIHAAGSGKGVRVQSFDYFCPTFAKRVL